MKEVGDSKVYVCLFICGVTRAVHLQIVDDLSVETLLQALRRFAACRSLPRILISDNASTFEAAARDLEELISSTQMSESLCTLGVQSSVHDILQGRMNHFCPLFEPVPSHDSGLPCGSLHQTIT